jgi:hypothetical protein
LSQQSGSLAARTGKTTKSSTARLLGFTSFQTEIKITLHTLTTAPDRWGGCQDWREREVKYPFFQQSAMNRPQLSDRA